MFFGGLVGVLVALGGRPYLAAAGIVCCVGLLFCLSERRRRAAFEMEEHLCGGDREKLAMWPLVQSQLERIAKKLEAMKYDIVGKGDWNLNSQTTALHNYLCRAFGGEVARHVELAPRRNETYGGEPDPLPPPENPNGEPLTRWHLDLYARELRRLADHGLPRQLQRYFKIGPDPF
jgi:hypothetical protein